MAVLRMGRVMPAIFVALLCWILVVAVGTWRLLGSVRGLAVPPGLGLCMQLLCVAGMLALRRATSPGRTGPRRWKAVFVLAVTATGALVVVASQASALPPRYLETVGTAIVIVGAMVMVAATGRRILDRGRAA